MNDFHECRPIMLPWKHVSRILALLGALAAGSTADAQSLDAFARRLPPPGIEIPASDRQELHVAVSALDRRLEQLRSDPNSAAAQRSLPDVEIYVKAVRYALRHDEFYEPRDAETAKELLHIAHERLDHLQNARTPWTAQRGLVVRGYRSRLDDSVQPYGLVIPKSLDLSWPTPLYVWLHGRGEKMTDLNFIHQRQTTAGTLAPPNSIVLHPFGRYCNAYKFAGEVDVFEAIQAVQANYRIDAERIVLWGFSMGGAGTWHLGAHHPDRWVAMSPGAGFAETARYQNLSPENYPPWYEQSLWHLFDVPSYTRNLLNLPVIAYSGELDKQIQAARIMEEAFIQEGRTLTHLIGPGMGHQYHPDTLAELSRRIAAHVHQGIDRFPKMITFQTRTLRYNRCHWLEVLGLEEHWRDARVDANLASDQRLVVQTRNVSALKLKSPWSDGRPFPAGFAVEMGDQRVIVPDQAPSLQELVLERSEDHWAISSLPQLNRTLRKAPGLQGPIDDVFMEPFLVVVPTGRCAHPLVDRWVAAELDHFQNRWRLLFRGDLRMKKDTEVTPDDVQQYHLVLWGDPASNRWIAQAAQRLPISWTANSITSGEHHFDAAQHVVSMIYPNVLQESPHRYLVFNSGLTFREGHDHTNSLQNPKLPDWAIIDLTQQPADQIPGKIAAAGFFDEHWQHKPSLVSPAP